MKFFNMSRMVKKQLNVVDGVKITNTDGNLIVSGKLGSTKINLNKLVDVDVSNGLSFKSLEEKDTGMLGTSYVLIRNAMKDLTDGFSASLKMIGVGFKASVSGKFLRVYIGLSHDVFFAIPEGVSVEVANDVDITIKGNDKSKVMQFARMIRDMKKPEPYKGKGIFLNGEKVLRKVGKKK